MHSNLGRLSARFVRLASRRWWREYARQVPAEPRPLPLPTPARPPGRDV